MGILNKAVNAYKTVSATHAANKARIAKASANAAATRMQAAAVRDAGKAQLVGARQAAKITAARAGMVTGSIGAIADAKKAAAKYNYDAQIAALNKWQSINKMNPEPVDNTGEPETGTETPKGTR